MPDENNNADGPKIGAGAGQCHFAGKRHDGARYGLIRTDNGEWEVYFSEHGRLRTSADYPDAQSAHRRLLQFIHQEGHGPLERIRLGRAGITTAAILVGILATELLYYTTNCGPTIAYAVRFFLLQCCFSFMAAAWPVTLAVAGWSLATLRWQCPKRWADRYWFMIGPWIVSLGILVRAAFCWTQNLSGRPIDLSMSGVKPFCRWRQFKLSA